MDKKSGRGNLKLEICSSAAGDGAFAPGEQPPISVVMGEGQGHAGEHVKVLNVRSEIATHLFADHALLGCGQLVRNHNAARLVACRGRLRLIERDELV